MSLDYGYGDRNYILIIFSWAQTITRKGVACKRDNSHFLQYVVITPVQAISPILR